LPNAGATKTVPSPEVGEKVSEGLIGQLLEVLHAILGELVEGVPSCIIELHATTLWHFPEV
jgi:hypothetical protein